MGRVLAPWDRPHTPGPQLPHLKHPSRGLQENDTAPWQGKCLGNSRERFSSLNKILLTAVVVAAAARASKQNFEHIVSMFHVLCLI